MDLTIRPIAVDELGAFLDVQFRAYGLAVPDEVIAIRRSTWDVGRSVAAFDATGRLVGTGSTELARLTVPGGSSSEAVTMANLAVLPEARGSGIAREVLSHQFGANADEGHPFAAFTVTEAAMPLHTSLGSGPTIPCADLRIRTAVPAAGVLPAPPDPAVPVAIEEAPASADGGLGELDALYDQVAGRTPGAVRPSDGWMEAFRRTRPHLDPDVLPTLVARDGDGRAVGYAHRLRRDREVVVYELVATTTRTRDALVDRAVADAVDAGREAVVAHVHPCDPLRWRYLEGRVGWDGLRTSLWLRIFDVAATLEARAYATDDVVTLAVEDPLLPATAGRFALGVVDGHGRCPRTDALADVRLTVGGLAMLYFGSTSAAALAASGHLVAPPDVRARLDALFAVDALPTRLVWL